MIASFVEPMQCLAVTRLPEGEAWQYELKLDGFPCKPSEVFQLADLPRFLAC